MDKPMIPTKRLDEIRREIAKIREEEEHQLSHVRAVGELSHGQAYREAQGDLLQGRARRAAHLQDLKAELRPFIQKNGAD